MANTQCLRRIFTTRSPIIHRKCLHGGRRVPLYLQSSRGISTGSSDYQVQPGQPDVTSSNQEKSGRKKRGDEEQSEGRLGGTLYKMFESAATTFASLAMLGLAGYSYHKYYKYIVLRKIEDAFRPGVQDDPVLRMVTADGDQADSSNDHSPDHWVSRQEQPKIDALVNGSDKGKYYLIIGETGTGKSSMLYDAMLKIDGEGVTIFEAHADLEIFRLRLGKCLDFEFHEDYVGSLFSIRGPRDTTALLDIERAMNKLEKIAIKRRKEVGRPLVLIVNRIHLLRDDEDGRDILELMQQKAEQWASSNLVTVIFNSDAYWVFERFKQYATRMEVLPIRDLTKKKALEALSNYRGRFFDETPSSKVLEEVYGEIGGRLAYLSRVARSPDMLQMCDHIRKVEKTWFLNQCWILGQTMDDDCEDQQKYAAAAMVFAKALVDREDELIQNRAPGAERVLPQIPLHEAREIMTRADFIKQYDQTNLFTINSEAMVRADSVPMQNAIREICKQPGFDEHLRKTLARLDELESLARTRELVAKDLVVGGRYLMQGEKNGKGEVGSGREVRWVGKTV